jgi:acetate kinase
VTPDGEILVVNCGSSSVKLGVFDASASHRLWSAGVERIGQAEPRLQILESESPVAGDSWEIHDHDAALRILFEAVRQRAPRSRLRAIGHRVVHGGSEFDRPQILDAAAEAKLLALVPLAPLHMPQSLAGVTAARRLWPNLPQIACFDTMFHSTLPPRAAMMALPRALFEQGVRRYGFHGLSYEFVVGALKSDGVDLTSERIIIAHLGAGASMCAIKNGGSIETTMGFSTLAGLPMSTRCGDLDPGAILHLLTDDRLSLDELQRLLYRESGLLGLSGISGDMKVLLAQADEPHAAEAIDFFCYQARRHVGALAAVLGGVDRLVFTGGIGVNAPAVRAQICGGLAFLGLDLDSARNAEGVRVLSSDASAVLVELRQTDEELVIARHVRDFMAAGLP